MPGRNTRGPLVGPQRGGRGLPRRGFGGPTNCVCPSCGTKATHQRGVPCSGMVCPKCGTHMVAGA